MLKKIMPKSNIAKVIFALSIICILITTLKYFNIIFFLIQSLIFLYFIRNVDCNIYGNCYKAAYLNLFIVCALTLFLVSDYFGIFRMYKKFVRRIYRFYEKYQRPENSHLKKLFFTNDSEVSDYYKNRKIPKLINKNFYHKSDDDDIEDDNYYVETNYSNLTKIQNNIKKNILANMNKNKKSKLLSNNQNNQICY